VLAATIILLVGVLDDVLELSAPAKAAGMVLAGSVLSLLGVSMLWFRVPFGGIVSVSPDLAPLVTVLWVLALANAVNFIDGLDGLAAGVVAIAAGAFALYSDHLFELGRLGVDNNSIGPLVAVVALGMCLGFLPFNVHPARVFMGDAGALLLGLLMACWTLLVGGGTHEAATGSTYFFLAPLLIPLIIMGVPVLDLAFAVVRRPQPPAPPPRAPGPRAAPLRVHPLGVDGHPLRARARHRVHGAGRRPGPRRGRGPGGAALHRPPPRGPPLPEGGPAAARPRPGTGRRRGGRERAAGPLGRAPSRLLAPGVGSPGRPGGRGFGGIENRD
jgi:hypothetical protein